jgi:hypothetical protein
MRRNESDKVLITGYYEKTDDTRDYDPVDDTVVTLLNSNSYNKNNIHNYGLIHPVIPVTTSVPTQKSIIDEFTLNKEQRAAFMIIKSYLDGDGQNRTGTFIIQIIIN